MKTIFQWMLSLGALAAVVQWNGTALAQFYPGAGLEMRSVLEIKADGSSKLTTETVEPRSMAEQQLRMQERYQKMSEAAEEGEGSSAPSLSATNETKPFTDEELSKKLAESMDERYEAYGMDPGGKNAVQVNSNTVVITITQAFPSLEEMLAEGYGLWQASGVAFENAQLETDTNGLLRLTLTPQSGMERYLKEARSQMKLSGMKTELKIVFPGKVVSSGFSATKDTATWLAVDGKDDQSVEAMLKLYTGPTVITAEPGGIKLAQPLESKKLARKSRERRSGGDDLPITDAGPGFQAEALSVATTTLHVFPGGEEYFERAPVSTGTVVTAKLFAPKGRSLLSANDVRVLSATDNQGRSVAPEAEDDTDYSSYDYSSNQEDTPSAQVQLKLKLPEPDAQSIDTLSAEAIAVTAGKWKEMTLTNLQQSVTNELDLSAVLPAAKIIITKYTSKDGQVRIQAKLTGPRTVQRLNVRMKVPGSDQINSYTSERRFTVKAGQATRNLDIQCYNYDSQDAALMNAAVLVIRYPDDLQRERVKFDLKALDLF